MQGEFFGKFSVKMKIQIMPFEPNRIYHIYNQGNNKQAIFLKEENYLFFLQKMRRHILPNVHFLAYCLMPNHFHWLVYVKEEGCLPSKSIKPKPRFSASEGSPSDSPCIFKMQGESEGGHYQQKLSQQIGVLLSSYTKAFNKQEDRTGSLFRGKTKYKDGWINGFLTVGSKNEHLLFRPDNDYARQCFEYIHQNPVKAGLSESAEDWVYSSAKDYAGLRNGTLCNQDLAREFLLSG